MSLMQCFHSARVRVAILAGTILLGGVARGSANDARDADIDYPWMVPLPLVPDPMRLRPKLTTLGSGWEYRHVLSSSWNVRLESLEYHRVADEVDDGRRLERSINLRSQSLLFDWFPWQNRFRISSGIYFNQGELRGSIGYVGELPSGDITASQVNDLLGQASLALRNAGHETQALSLDQYAATNTNGLAFDGSSVDVRNLATVSARLRLPPYAPYLGVGWTGANRRELGWFYSADLGLMYLGRSRVEYQVSGTLADAVRAQLGSRFDALLDEQERLAEEKLSDYRYYPMFSFGAWYRF